MVFDELMFYQQLCTNHIGLTCVMFCFLIIPTLIEARIMFIDIYMIVGSFIDSCFVMDCCISSLL